MAQYSMTFKTWFEGHLAWLLKQRPEGTSEATPYQRMDSETCRTAVNFVISELCLESPRRYSCVQTFTFDEDTNRFHLPYEVAKVISYFDTTMQDFEKVPGETEVGYAIRKESDDVLYNENGWTKGDTIQLNFIKRPPRINTENDIVYFPEEYMLLLSIKVSDWVKIQSGENSNISHDREYIRLMQKWRSDGGRMSAEFRTKKPAYSPIRGA
jgi:hypothetical protein